VACAPALVPAVARAQQIDTNPPLPNVLLLVDNSGSMERMINGSVPESNASTACNCDAWTGLCNFSAQPTTANRWGVLVQALTGSVQGGYNCTAMPRTPGSIFATEYQINGVAPYDTNYYLPYHRPVANAGGNRACVYAPGALPGAATPNGVGFGGVGVGPTSLATDFPAGAIVQRTYGMLGPVPCTFQQLTDGALDAQRDVMRFGLMTFDQDPDPSTGVTGSNTVATPAFAGMWSYFPGWNSGGSPPYGNPANCVAQPYAVGARNPAAPPWEGRMMPFPVTSDIATQEASNDNIQQVLLASRPYGATPLAGMFKGAQYYLQSDPSGPNGDTQHADPYVQGGCRNQYIIVLTDGMPNMDLRKSCEPATGVCPFPHPYETAQNLNQKVGNEAPILTYVIGFAVSSFQDQGTTLYCSSLVTSGQLSSKCDVTNPDPAAAPCCELQKIAVFGGTNQAYFADTPGDLSTALGAILSQIANKATTRTIPVYSPVITSGVVSTAGAPATNAQIFLASFNPSPGKAWSGDVQRQRYVCTGQTGGNFSITAPLPDKTMGDDFAANLNSASSGSRFFIAMLPDQQTDGSVHAEGTIRPYVSTSVGDGLGQYSATTYAGTDIVSYISPDALQVTNNSCTYNPTGGGSPTQLLAPACRDLLLDYTFGLQSFSSNPGNYPFVSRYGNAFGDVFHATPAAVGPPGSLLRDDGYISFATSYATRKQMLYVATNDGLLHAFWADENTLTNNEAWAFLPPAVMPNILASYPSSRLFLLDGSPIVKDVVWDRPPTQQGNASVWHTTLVAGFGASQRGYYALDVTKPDPGTRIPLSGGVMPLSAKAPADPPAGGGLVQGPVFLWQLTTMPTTNARLFGVHSGTPAITSLFMNPDNTVARDIGVAILPGGEDSAPTTSLGNGSSCTRCTSTSGCTTKTSDSAPVNSYAARTAVRCWGQNHQPLDPVVGRSLSVVRLDTGEIVRVFMRVADVPQSTDTLYKANPSRIIDTPLDSPMIGVPVVYPSDVGTDATKVFVADADGTVWRFDLSNPDPSQWFGELFLDLYNTTADTSSTSWSDGQPVEVPPVTSLDPSGNLVLNVATGSQAQFDTTGVDYVYSISETINSQATPTKLRAQVNWWLNPTTVTNDQPGERVSGPMTVFDGVFYFATYAAADPQSQTCKSGNGRIWGLDFVNPLDKNTLSKGGTPRVTMTGNHNGQYIQPDESDSTLSGVVIPGVSIKSSTACSGTTSGPDQYVGGAMHQTPSGMSAPANYSLFTQLGKPGSNGASTQQFEVQVPTPVSPTVIDSWAAVLE
jgi:type IV pilus assembly protein PilY1